MKAREVYVMPYNENIELTKSQFDNGVCCGPEFWLAEKDKSRNFYSAKALAESLINNPNGDYRSGWNNMPLSERLKSAVIKAYHMFYG